MSKGGGNRIIRGGCFLIVVLWYVSPPLSFLPPLCFSLTSGANKAHKKFHHKEFWAPKGGPDSLYVWPFFLYFEGRRGPKHKEFEGSGVAWRWSGMGVSGEILCVYALCRGLKTETATKNLH